MKANNYLRLFFALIVATLIAGCSAATKEDDKKARLEKLKTQQADISKEIKKLEEEISKENPGAVKTVKAKEVAVTVIEPRKFDHYVQTQGRIEAENDVMVSAKASGVVTAVYVTEGSQVSKGQTLAQIDNSVITQSIKSMEAQLELATSVYNRQENLWKQKIGTEVQYLQAKTNKESLEKQIASLREQNEMYKIKSPIAGTVDQLIVKVGESVSFSPAARIVNVSDLKFVAAVSEAYVTNIKKGNAVTVSIPELKKEIKATVTFVGRAIDPLSRTFAVEAKLSSYEYLRPNMTATVKVVFNTEKDALVVPVNVIQQLNDQKVVYVAELNGTNTIARKKVITVDGVYGGFAQVKGLEAGDKLITVGFQGLSNGDFVKI